MRYGEPVVRREFWRTIVGEKRAALIVPEISDRRTSSSSRKLSFTDLTAAASPSVIIVAQISAKRIAID